MARVRDWLRSNADRLQILLVRHDWTKLWLPGFSDYSVSMVWRGRRVFGRGTDLRADIAITKAVAECLERCAIDLTDHPNTSGLAVHTNRDAAARAAWRELVERDAFFCHWLTKQPFERIAVKALPSLELERFSKTLTRHGCDLIFGRMETVAHFGVVCVISGAGQTTPWGISVGLGVADTQDDAAQHALIEAMRSAALSIESSGSALAAMAMPPRTPEEHLLCAASVAGLEALPNLFGASNIRESPMMSRDHAVVHDLDLNIIVGSVPFVGVSMVCAKLQPCFFGPLRREVVNLARLEQFAGRKLLFEDLNDAIHPFG